MKLGTFDESKGTFNETAEREMLSGDVKDIAFMHIKKPKIIAVGESNQYYAKCVNNNGGEHGKISGPSSALSCCAVNKTNSFRDTLRLFMGAEDGKIYLSQ